MSWFSRKNVVVEEEPSTQSEEATTTTGKHCAWCGDPGDEFGSHGICTGHAEQLDGTVKWRSLQRTPSYVERFKNGREQWEDEE